jgi:RimJ/RimL family protein N-acetyltransferase
MINGSDISKIYLETLNDKTYMRYSRNSQTKHTIITQSHYINEANASEDLLFGIRTITDNRLVGTIRCRINKFNKSIELGFLIFKGSENKGYASETLKYFIEELGFFFQDMTLVIGTDKKNLPMQRIASKQNFIMESEVKSNSTLRFTRKIKNSPNTYDLTLAMKLLKSRKIGIVAHDPGGANQIIWLIKKLNSEILAYLSGPAVNIFARSQILFKSVSNQSELKTCDLVITGSSSTQDFEKNVIRYLRREEIPNLTVLDHWVNYSNRFNPDATPSVFATTNEEAFELAKNKFKNSQVFLLPDLQLLTYKKVIRNFKSREDFVLVLLEPISDSNGEFSCTIDTINEMVDFSIRLNKVRNLDGIILRLHPSQQNNANLRLHLTGMYPNTTISLNEDLIDDLLISRIAIGANSYALYLAHKCEIDTMSLFANKPEHWTNSYPGILPFFSL